MSFLIKIESLHVNGHKSIPTDKGIYIVIKPRDFSIELTAPILFKYIEHQPLLFHLQIQEYEQPIVYLYVNTIILVVD